MFNYFIYLIFFQTIAGQENNIYEGHIITEVKQANILDDSMKYIDSFPIKANWFLANKICRMLGHNLLSIETEEKELEVEEFIRRRNITIGFQHQIWTSGTDNRIEGAFYWASTGNFITYKKWDINQPSIKEGGEDENCLSLRKRYNSVIMWNDAICDSKYELICEINENQIPEATLNKYFLSYPIRAKWHEAFMFCKKMGRDLVSIESNQKQTEIQNFIDDSNLSQNFMTWDTQIWTSGTDQYTEGSFYWMSSGNKLSFTNFITGEPNNVVSDTNETENCVGLRHFEETGLLWNDNFCWRQFFFICEKKHGSYLNTI